MRRTALRLPYRPPYDWDHVLSFLAARAIPGVERVDAGGYERTLPQGRGHVRVSVRHAPRGHALELHVRGAGRPAVPPVAARAARVFDLAADPARIAAAFAADPLLGPLVRQRPGLRILGVWDPFECAVRAILGQQVSVAAGRTLVGRVVARAGRPLRAPVEGLTHLFPAPADLAAADLAGLGLTGGRMAALRTLAGLVAGGRLRLEGRPDAVALAIAAVPGCGPWTAQYVALRGLAHGDAFPASDLVLRRAAGAGGAPLGAAALARRAEAWRPWRGYAAIHLWRAAGDAFRDRASAREPARG